MSMLKLLFNVFTKVVTCILIGSATYTWIFFPEASLSVNFIWQLILCSFLTSLGTLLYTESSTKVTIIKCFIHYIWVNIVVVACGILFDWFNPNSLSQVVSLLFMIAAIFLIVSALTWRKAIQTADLMNEKLKEYQENSQENNQTNN